MPTVYTVPGAEVRSLTSRAGGETETDDFGQVSLEIVMFVTYGYPVG